MQSIPRPGAPGLAAFVLSTLAFGGCLSEDTVESDVILQLDVRTEHEDDRPEWRLLARLQITGVEAPPEDPNEIVGRLQPPSGEPIFFRASDWDPSQSRYEIARSTYFASLVASGTYVASVPGPEGGDLAVQDTVESRFLDLPTITNPVYGEFVSCEPLLRWRPVPRAERYQVLLRRRLDHVTVISDVVRETKMLVPPGLLAPDTVYEWKVYAFDRSPDGDVDNQSKGRFSRMVVTYPCRGAGAAARAQSGDPDGPQSTGSDDDDTRIP